MATSKTGLLHGTTIELESPVPEMEGKRVRVVLEAVDELQISEQRQRELWQAWADGGPQGPIDDGAGCRVPVIERGNASFRNGVVSVRIVGAG
jgi:hypothetical protein